MTTPIQQNCNVARSSSQAQKRDNSHLMKENVPQGQENTVISVRASFTGQPLGDRANLVRIQKNERSVIEKSMNGPQDHQNLKISYSVSLSDQKKQQVTTDAHSRPIRTSTLSKMTSMQQKEPSYAEPQSTPLLQKRVSLLNRVPLAELQPLSDLRENNRETLLGQPQQHAGEQSFKDVQHSDLQEIPTANKVVCVRSQADGAPKRQQKGLQSKNHAKTTAQDTNSPSQVRIIPVRQRSVQLPRLQKDLKEKSILIETVERENAQDPVTASQMSILDDQYQATEGKSGIDEDNDGVESTAYNRKEKSLGELCRRFLFLYGTPQRGLLYLDQCTKELGVERRRIYDIINILESFSVIQRCAKNEYQWRGIDKIIHSIEKQIQACVKDTEEKYTGQALKQQNSLDEVKDSLALKKVVSELEQMDSDGNLMNGEDQAALSSQQSRSSAEEQKTTKKGGRRAAARSQKKQAKYKKVKSLGNFCQQFIRLFVTWKDVLSLEEAAKQISDGEIFDEKLLKTKIRRLYDIANVLQSIGLIHKTQMSNSRKPAFKWIGLRGVQLAIQEIKNLVKTAQIELNSQKAGSVKSSVSGLKSSQGCTGVEWLVKQNSVRVNASSKNLQKQESAVSSKRNRGIQSPPRPSPLKLKRSASFIEASPAKGSLIIEQRKRQWALQQKITLGKPNANQDEEIHQQSEGNILEVSGGRKRSRQPASSMAIQGMLVLDEQNDEADDAEMLSDNLKKLDQQQNVVQIRKAHEGPLFADQNATEIEETSPILAGKKRNNRQHLQDSDSFVSDMDCEIGDSYGKQVQIQNNKVVKLNKQEEDDMIRELENQAMENDTLAELEEALLDRTTAHKNLRNRSHFMSQHTKINSSNFQKSNQEPSQVIKKLKHLSQQQQSRPDTPAFKQSSQSKPGSAQKPVDQQQVAKLNQSIDCVGLITQPTTATKTQAEGADAAEQANISDQMQVFQDFEAQNRQSQSRPSLCFDEPMTEDQRMIMTVSEFNQNTPTNHKQLNTSMKKKSTVKEQMTTSAAAAANSSEKPAKEAQEFQSPQDGPIAQRLGGSRRKAKQADKKDSLIGKACGNDNKKSMTDLSSGLSQQYQALIPSQAITSSQQMLANGSNSMIDQGTDERLPILGRHPQISASSSLSASSERDYLLSLQSFRFCLRSLPLIKQLSATMIEKTTISSNTANDESSSQQSIIGH